MCGEARSHCVDANSGASDLQRHATRECHDVERTLSAHPGIAQVAVIGVPDERLGKAGMVFIVPRPGHFSGTTQSWEPALHAFCRERMASYKVPRQFAVVSSLPVSAAGKVLKTQRRASAGVVQQAHAAHK